MNKMFFLRHICLMTFLFVFLITPLAGCGEQYRKEAQSLLWNFYAAAPSYGICNDLQDCRKKEIALIEGGGKIYVNLYGVENLAFIAKLSEISLIESASTYQGITIVVSVYKTSKKNTYFFQKPFFKMEIK